MTEFGYDNMCPNCGEELEIIFLTETKLIKVCGNCGEIEA